MPSVGAGGAMFECYFTGLKSIIKLDECIYEYLAVMLGILDLIYSLVHMFRNSIA
jgi:hypothetical protein